MLQRFRSSIVALLFILSPAAGCTNAPPQPEAPSTQKKGVVAAPAAKKVEAPPVEVKKPPKRLNTQDNPAYSFTYSTATVFGPPRPPVHIADPLAAKDFLEWTDVLTYAPEGKGLAFVPTALDAALDINSVNNRGMLLMEFAQAGDFEMILRKYMPPEYEYMGFLATLGQDYTEGALDKLKAHFEKQLHGITPEFGRYLEPMPTRRDRIIGQYRLTQWSFRYQTPSGEEKIGCFLMVLMENAWRMLDMECAPQEWDDQK